MERSRWAPLNFSGSKVSSLRTGSQSGRKKFGERSEWESERRDSTSEDRRRSLNLFTRSLNLFPIEATLFLALGRLGVNINRDFQSLRGEKLNYNNCTSLLLRKSQNLLLLAPEVQWALKVYRACSIHVVFKCFEPCPYLVCHVTTIENV